MSEHDLDLPLLRPREQRGATKPGLEGAREAVTAAGIESVRRIAELRLAPTLIAVHSGYQRIGLRRRENPVHRMVAGWTVRKPFVYTRLGRARPATKAPGIYLLEDGSVLIDGVGAMGPISGSDYVSQSGLGAARSAEEIVHALEVFLTELET